MKNIILKIFLIPLAVLLNSCGSSNSDNAKNSDNSTNPPSEVVNSEVVSSTIARDTTYSLQKLAVDVYEGDKNVTKALMADTRSMAEKVTAMAEDVNKTIELSGNLVKILAKEFTFNSDYSSQFKVNSSYDIDHPCFAISAATNRNFFLVASSARLFPEKKTIKTYFHDSASLLAAWQRSLSHYTSGNLYMNIYEITTDGTVKRVGNGLTIPASKMENYVIFT